MSPTVIYVELFVIIKIIGATIKVKTIMKKTLIDYSTY
jgi:hypothetical protein